MVAWSINPGPPRQGCRSLRFRAGDRRRNGISAAVLIYLRKCEVSAGEPIAIRTLLVDDEPESAASRATRSDRRSITSSSSRPRL